MEPSLHDGDILLVRKSDVLPFRQYKRWTSQSYDRDEESEEQHALRVIALDAQSDRPIGDTMTGYTYLHPPTIYIPGSVVVFRAPDAEKYPRSEYRVKRVIGLGGQLVRNGSVHFKLEKVPSFGLWVEGDNHHSDENESSSDDKAGSVDSRTYGAISKNLVVGVAESIIWPPSRWSRIPCITSPVLRSWWPYD
jgi:signal peptidase I